MTDTTTTPAHRFTLGGALGFGFDVFRARPKSVLILLIVQTLLYTALYLGQYMLLGYMARQGVQAAELGDSAGAYVLNMQFSSVSSVYSLLGLPLWLWLEAVWLTLFMSGRFTLLPGWAGIGRLALSWLILFGVYLASLFAVFLVSMIGGVIAVMIIENGTGDSSVAVVLVAVGFFVLLLLAMSVALAVFSGLPAHALSGRFDIGGAIRTGWRHAAGLTTAWIVFTILYMLVIVISYGVIAAWVGEHVVRTFEDAFQNPSDPLMSMRLYAELVPGPDKLGISALVLLPVTFLMGVVMVMARGISAKLALSMPEPEQKAA